MKFAAIMFLVLIAYFPIIGATTVSPDAHIILRPLLETGFFEYLRMLQNFGTVDFQPVRDLTFFMDIAVFKLTGFNSFALTNVLLWGAGCCLIFSLLKRQNPELNSRLLLLAVAAFAVYPLFSQGVSWTMARKHVLAFTLILLTTHFFLDWLKGKRRWISFVLLYVLSALSQPIVLFWPVWAATHVYLFHSEKWKDSRKIFSVLGSVMLVLLLTNYAYYTVLNDQLRDYYTQAKPEFSVFRIFLHASFYIRELFWPYQLSFVYYPTIGNSWMGAVIAVLIGALIFYQKRDRRLLSWIVFALVPFPVFLGISVYDQYLILPATGLFLAFTPYLERFSRWTHFVFPVLIISWTIMTFTEASAWTNNGALWLRNFESAPSCRSVIQALNSMSQSDLEIPVKAFEFYKKENCFSVYPKLPAAEKPKAIVAQALYLFQASGALSDREIDEELKNLGTIHYFPLLLYAIRKAQSGHEEEVRSATDFIFDRVNGPLEDTGPLAQNVLGAYCSQHKLDHCLILLSGNKTKLPYQ